MAGALISLFAYPAQHSAIERAGGELVEKTIMPGKMHEECLLVRANQQLHYEFDASVDVEFNVHYHDVTLGRIIYLFGPSLVGSTPDMKGYRVQESQVLCLMWNNTHAEAIRLEYSLGVSQ